MILRMRVFAAHAIATIAQKGDTSVVASIAQRLHLERHRDVRVPLALALLALGATDQATERLLWMAGLPNLEETAGAGETAQQIIDALMQVGPTAPFADCRSGHCDLRVPIGKSHRLFLALPKQTREQLRFSTADWQRTFELQSSGVGPTIVELDSSISQMSSKRVHIDISPATTQILLGCPDRRPPPAKA